MSPPVTILGTGQMAVMCATMLRDNHLDVRMVGRPETIHEIQRTWESPQMPGVPISRDVKLVTSDEVSQENPHTMDDHIFVVAVPTQAIRKALDALGGNVFSNTVVCCSKGIEQGTFLRPSEVVEQFVSCHSVALSGPNIASEVVQRKPAGAVVAGELAEKVELVRAAFSTDYFRVYTNDDIIGVELAGALKNVIALAAGIIDGLQLGDNAKASLIARGLVEITRFGTELGAKPETFHGLAGMGDLITTCISPHGRNRTVGQRIGQGETLDDILADLGSVCEGVPTTKAVLQIAQRERVEMPICSAVASILFDGRDVREVLLELMTREPKAES